LAETLVGAAEVGELGEGDDAGLDAADGESAVAVAEPALVEHAASARLSTARRNRARRTGMRTSIDTAASRMSHRGQHRSGYLSIW
jgi:hypothetical protein